MGDDESRRARFKAAEADLSGARLMHDSVDEERIVKRHGFGDMNAYRAAEFSEPVTVTTFKLRWKAYHHKPNLSADYYERLDARMDDLLRAALALGESSIQFDAWTADGWHRSIVDPLALTRWLAALPDRSGLIPKNVAEYVLRDAPAKPRIPPPKTSAARAAGKRNVGAPPKVFERLVAEMLEEDPARLAVMTGPEMKARFGGADPKTCRKARKEVQGIIAARGNN